MYTYSLEDFYIIFAQAETTEEKIDLLESWSTLSCQYSINWDRLLRAWKNLDKLLLPGERKKGYS